MKTKKKMTVGRAALYIIVYIAALFWIFPVIWMLVSSLKPYGTPVSILSKVCLLYTSFHGRVHRPMAKILAKKLEAYDPMFIEEPVLCENMECFREIAAACQIPIATGERLYSKWDFKRLFQMGGVDIIQPDLSHAGGITEVKKIASMAEAHDVALAPHCPLGPIALSSCLQVDATCYNAVIQEQSMGCLLYTSRCV